MKSFSCPQSPDIRIAFAPLYDILLFVNVFTTFNRNREVSNLQLFIYSDNGLFVFNVCSILTIIVLNVQRCFFDSKNGMEFIHIFFLYAKVAVFGSTQSECLSFESP